MTKHKNRGEEGKGKKRHAADEVNCGMLTLYSAFMILVVAAFVYYVVLSGEDVDLEDEF